MNNNTEEVPRASAKLTEHEYLLVSDKTSEVLKSDSDYMVIKKLAGIIRKAGGEVTIFKAIKG